MLRTYLLVLPALVILDLLWTGFLAHSLYESRLGVLMRTYPVWLAIIVFYLMYAFAIVYFVVEPSFSINDVLIRGGFFGLTVYGTYDLINFGLLKNWPLSISVIDMLWGTALTAIVGFVGFVF